MAEVEIMEQRAGFEKEWDEGNSKLISKFDAAIAEMKSILSMLRMLNGKSDHLCLNPESSALLSMDNPVLGNGNFNSAMENENPIEEVLESEDKSCYDVNEQRNEDVAMQLEADSGKIGTSNGESTEPSFTGLKWFSGKFYSISTIEEVECPSLKDGVELMNKAEELLPSKTEAVEVAYPLFDEMLNPALTGLLTTKDSFSISLLGNEVISSPYEVGTRLADEHEQSHLSKHGIVELRIGEVRSIMEVFLGKNVLEGDAHKVFDERLKLSSSLIDDDIMF